MNKEHISKIFAELSRILIGVTFVFSGTVKAIDPTGFAIKIGEYLASFGLDYFEWMNTFSAFAVIAFEFTLGICTLLAVYRKLVTLGVLIFMCFMTPLTLYLAIFNPVADCGCFGDALIITNWETFFKNVVLLAAAITAYIYHKRLTSCYTYKAYWFVVLFSYFFCIAFCFYNYDHLPIIDFRPYKVGNNIFKLMEIPEDAPRDVFHYIYEKERVQKEFALEDAPVGDSTWTYVDAKLIKQGFVPKVSSFELYDADGENVADELLHRPEALFLLVAPSLAKAGDNHIEQINNVYDYARNTQSAFYCVTNSSEEEIAGWKKDTGADYPFLTADDVLLKTMIRSNPGLVLLKEGTILAKWHHNDIPEENEWAEVIAGYLPETPLSGSLAEAVLAPPVEKNKKEDHRWWRIISGFTLPLLLIWLYDFFRNRRKHKKKTGL
ncbi:MAG: DoxX family protein [Tannerella sp.]|nr:DoxX family protein [Tannerella sp.]